MSVTQDISPLSRRSFSLPVSRNSPAPDPQIEVLYTLNSARIISFNTPSTPGRPGSSSGLSADGDDIGKLSWTSRFETTIAVGPLQIYRAPGSVAFLKCANALRPVLPKSQAWCVDGDSKFVLQVRRPQYWRIEVSNKSDEERLKVEGLKQVLGEVLLFEKTPCPFQRDFVVDLPEAPTTPVTKRPWKPVQGPRPQTPLSPEASIDYGYGNTPFGRRASSASPLRQSLLSVSRRNSELDLGSTSTTDETPGQRRDMNTPPNEHTTTILETEESSAKSELEANKEETVQLQPAAEELPSESIQDTSESTRSITEQHLSDVISQDDSDNFSEATDDTNVTPRPRGRLQSPIPVSPIIPDHSQRAETESPPLVEAKIVPPLLSIVTSAPVKDVDPLRVPSPEPDEDTSFSSSVESFHSVQSWHSLSPTDSQPSSPSQDFYFHDEDLLVTKRPHHVRETEFKKVPESPRTWEVTRTPEPEVEVKPRVSSPEPKTPTLTHDGSEKSEDERFEITTPPSTREGLRHRATTGSNSRRRQLSPLPAAVNLFSPTRSRPRHLQTGRHLPTAIIQKTCEILLSPPSHLFNLMLNIASKIAAGEWRGVLLGHGEAVHWDFEDEYAEETCIEDDYGIGLHPATKNNRKSQGNNSWEVD